MTDPEFDQLMMQRAVHLAENGQGQVEPNPMVGCVVTQGRQVVGEGWHERYGESHAEVNALSAAEQYASGSARGATLYVTLEPCCHHGKTPPCSQAVIEAGIARVVVAQPDPFGEVDGGGIRQLCEAGIDVKVGVLQSEAERLTAPYLKLVTQHRPWVIGKWAMTLDGKIASRDYHSQWISNEASRQLVHELRGRVDAIMVGRETAARDNPRLTARPAGARTATRIVVDSTARLSPDSHLAQTAHQIPLLVATGGSPSADRVQTLEQLGCEVFRCSGETHAERLQLLLDELGRRRMTNLLVEGGGQLFGSLLDLKQLDEVHAFIAPKLIGGQRAITPIAGVGAASVDLGTELSDCRTQIVGKDIYVHGRTPFAASRAQATRRN